MERDKSILLESGTGEVEILHFTVNGEHYAINVIKVKEILHINNISKVPNAHASVPGVSLVRGDVMTVIDMSHVLDGKKNPKVAKSMALICEFNQLKVAFAIDQVLGITRVKWSELKKPDEITASGLVIGNINLNNQILMLLDFERIVTEIAPASGINVDDIDVSEDVSRANLRIVLADDSPMIRRLLKDTLTKAGFKRLKFFDDGQEALDYLMGVVDRRKDSFIEEVQLLITDIEMPEMDGHTLTRRVKEHPIMRKLPVLIFSSLITGDLKHKGDSVGADGQMSKPEIGQLIDMVDQLIADVYQ